MYKSGVKNAICIILSWVIFFSDSGIMLVGAISIPCPIGGLCGLRDCSLLFFIKFPFQFE